MGKALYRTYRPRSLKEVVGQEHVTTTLRHALASGKISHAYLLTGPRGVGKTSIARILAHEINALPYSDEANHLDIIEIDAASNRRIDEIRDLRDRVHIAPTSAKYKVYIIDEVHMLTKEAFNALLKTLEEPPAHVVFILATTEAHKLPETIISRTQRFSFKPIADDAMIRHLKHIAGLEKITIDDDALALIAQTAAGGMRDSASLLDQIRNSATHITIETVRETLGIAPAELISQLVDLTRTGDTAGLVTALESARNNGHQAPQVSKQIIQALRQELIRGADDSTGKSLKLMDELLRVPSSRDPDTALEIALVGHSLVQPQSPSTTPQRQPNPPQTQPAPSAAPSPKVLPPAEPTAQQDAPAEPVAQTAPPSDPIPHESLWAELLEQLKKTNNTLYGVVRMAQPTLSKETLHMDFSFGFHHKRINEPRNKQIIAENVAKLLGHPLTITSAVVKEATPAASVPTPVADTKTPNADPLDSIKNIFGDAEVLDS